MSGYTNCDRHGVQQECFVCFHLPVGARLGFHQADDPGNARQDAWCDACEELRDTYGALDNAPKTKFKAVLVCAECYDLIQARNENRP